MDRLNLHNGNIEIIYRTDDSLEVHFNLREKKHTRILFTKEEFEKIKKLNKERTNA